MQRYEYLELDTPSVENLDEFGQSGWHVVAAHYHDQLQSGQLVKVLMERPAEKAEE